MERSPLLHRSFISAVRRIVHTGALAVCNKITLLQIPAVTITLICNPKNARSSLPDPLLILQELLLLDSTLLQVDEPGQQPEAQTTQSSQEVEGQAVVAVRAGADDRRAHDRTDESTSLTHDAEQGEEQELFATRGDFADHDLRVRVPGADEESVPYLFFQISASDDTWWSCD